MSFLVLQKPWNYGSSNMLLTLGAYSDVAVKFNITTGRMGFTVIAHPVAVVFRNKLSLTFITFTDF